MLKKSRKWKEKIEGLKLAVKWTYQSSPFLTIAILVITVLGGLITIVEPYIFKLILDYCFNRLRMHKATLYTADYNKVAINLYKKFGFKKEGILKEHLLKSGKYYDLYVMSLFERNYKKSR